jgi:hypothetical protein
MTEAEWLACTDLQKRTPLLGISSISDRKGRLFACAFCRRHWHLLPDEQSRQAIDVAEGFAEGGVGERELQAAHKAAMLVAESVDPPEPTARTLATLIPWVAQQATHPVFGWLGTRAVSEAVRIALIRGGVAEERAQEVMMRLFLDVYGNPCRPVAVEPAWLTRNCGTVLKLAQAIYEERAFDRLPILADALEDAGCDNADLLAHCRGPGPHVRGCWVVDLLLGKS